MKTPKPRVQPEMVIGHAAFYPFPQPHLAPEDLKLLLRSKARRDKRKLEKKRRDR